MPAQPHLQPSDPSRADADDVRARLWRGCALTVPAALLGIAVAMRLDAWLDLPSWARGLFALGWFGAVALAGWGWSAVPARTAGRGLVPTLAGLLAVLSLAMVPAAGERLRRLVLPFYRPLPDRPFRLVVSSGNPVVRTGDSVTLTAYAEPTRPDAALPETAILTARVGPRHLERRLTMTSDGRGGFHVTRPDVTADFEYRIEAGNTVTDWHTVAVAEPVEVADGTTFTVESPDYARPFLPARSFAGFVGFDGLQGGRVTLKLKLNRLAHDARLEWRQDSASLGSAPTYLPLAFDADRLEYSAAFDLTGPGTLKLILTGERNLRTERAVTVHAAPDRSPRFETVVGLSEGPREVRPDGMVLLTLAVRDDVRVREVRIDYAVNDGATQDELLDLSGIGTALAMGETVFPLSGKVKPGDSLRLRVRVADDRASIVYPAMGWAMFRVVPTARPLYEQDVLAQRDRVKSRLGAAVAMVADADRTATQMGGVDAASIEGSVVLGTAREQTRDAARSLDELADELELIPELRPLAGALREVAANPLARAATDFGSGEGQAGRSHLALATTRLADLTARADGAAQARLDRHALRQIAAEIAAGSLDGRARIAQLLANSPAFKAADAAAAATSLRRVITDIERLHDHYQDLIAAIIETDRLARSRAFGALARRQAEQAARAAALFSRLDLSMRIVGYDPPTGRAAADAMARLQAQRAGEATAEQEKAASELDRLAETIRGAAASRADPKAAAAQLARWQENLNQRVNDAGPLAPADRERFKAELKAIQTTTNRLVLPPGSGKPVGAKSTALDALSAAATLSADAMASAHKALLGLADAIPSHEKRRENARPLIEGLRAKQVELARSAGDVRNFAELAKLEESLADTIAGVDAPGLGHRVEAATAAVRRAAADLRVGLALDVPISLRTALRQIDRLRQSADGTTPNDETAAELAALQRAVADASARLPAKPTDDDMRPLRQSQSEIARRIGLLLAPEAQGLLADARAAVNHADEVARSVNAGKHAPLAAAAASALARLADRLIGIETDLDRVDRLAKERAAAADAARLAPRVPPTPEEAARTAAQLHRVEEDLDQTRVGAAQAVKKAVLEALARLRQAPDANRQPGLQQTAADALRRLADQMRKNGDRSDAHPLPQKAVSPDPADPKGDGRLPTRADADEAASLARSQRELRDAVSRANAELARGITPTPDDPLAALANEQTALADKLATVSELAATQAQRAVDALRVGSPNAAAELDEAGYEIEAATLDPAAVPDTVELLHRLHRQQVALTDRVRSSQSDLGNAAARQHAERTALAAQAAWLAAELDQAALRLTATRPGSVPESLLKAAHALRQAEVEVQQAVQDAMARRSSIDADRRADAALKQAADLAKPARPALPQADDDYADALAAVRQAEVLLQGLEAKSGNAGRVAERLSRAAAALTPTANGVGRE